MLREAFREDVSGIGFAGSQVFIDLVFVIDLIEMEDRIHGAEVVYDIFRVFRRVLVEDGDGDVDAGLFLGDEDDEERHEDYDCAHDVHCGIYEASLGEDR